jgi:hypothetical protein
MRLKIKLARILCCLIVVTSILTGCEEKNEPVEKPIEPVETTIEQRYENVNKAELSYEITSSAIFYETKNSIVGIDLLEKIPSYDNKRYGQILTDFTYFSEENPTNVSYEEALKLAASVLPDDIKEERIKYDEEVGKNYIVYSSSKGTFILGLCHGLNKNDSNYNKDIIVGIDYMKEKIK